MAVLEPSEISRNHVFNRLEDGFRFLVFVFLGFSVFRSFGLSVFRFSVFCFRFLVFKGRAESERGLSSPVPDQQRSLLLMISFFDWDPSDPEHSAQSNSMPNPETRAHSSVSPGQLPRRFALRQNTRNTVHVFARDG